jgi:hypothetical protein
MDEMQEELDRLHREITQLRAERAQLSQALFALMGDEVTLTKQEILAQIGHEQPLRELLQEMRAQLVEIC